MLNGLKPLVFASLLGAAVGAQGQPPTASAKAPDDSKEPFVIENLRTIVSFESDGTGRRETTAEVRVKSEAGVQQFGLLTFGYSSANERIDIGFVRVRKADGTVVATAAEDVQDMAAEVTRAAPMFSDYREKHVAVKGLGAGDKLEYQVRTQVHTPLIPRQFWSAYSFFKAGIVLKEELELSAPKDREVNVRSPELEPTVTEEGNRRIYRWKTAHTERAAEDEKPIRELPPPPVEISTFRSWEDVGRWWGSLERERVTPTPEIRAKATELTKNAKTDAEKLRAIYDYVATKFRYISISFGIGRYQPHAAVEVLKDEYGACKDKHTLLASLLEAAGLEAYPALVNSTRKVDPEIPSPGQFDHVISVVPQGKDLVWLDTTTEVAPLGLLLANLRDRQALVIPPGKPASLVKTPAEPPFRSSQVFEAEGKLSDTGTLEAKMQLSLRGDVEVLLRAAFRRVPQPKWKDLVQALSYGAGFAGEVSNVTATEPDATDSPFQYSYAYTRKDYSDWGNMRIMPALPPLGLPAPSEDASKPVRPIELGAPGEVLLKSKIELPKGYTPTLPAPVELSRDFADYRSTSTLKDGVLYTERRLITKAKEVPATQKDDYRSFQKAVSHDENQFIPLTTGTEAAASVAVNPEVTKLYEQGREAVQQRDLNGALDLFERAVKLEPKYRDAWLAVGSVRTALGQTDEGLEAYRKAIEIDPKDPKAYKVLGFTLMSLRRLEEAMQTWRDLLTVDPNEKDAHANLGNILMSLEKYSEAVPELEAAVAVNKASSHLELALANAYLGTGNNDKAVTAFLKGAEMDLHPVTWNDVAYVLADHNLSLPEAQRYAERAVKSVEDDAAGVTLDKLKLADLERMTELATFWDTLGWVYFREGNLEKAERYLEAAWNLEQGRVISEHLAQIYEKHGKKAAATHQYTLAHALPGTASDEGPPPLLRRRDGSFVAAEMRKTPALEELSQMRRVKLGRISAKEGSAEFFVLFSSGSRINDVKFVSGSAHLRSGGKAIAASKFKAPLPDDAPTKLVRRGVLVCSGFNLGCDFTLFTPESVNSTK